MRETFRRLKPYLWLAAVTVVCVSAIQYTAAEENRDDNITACDRGNFNRSSDYEAAKGDADDALYFMTQEHDPELRLGWKKRYERKTIEARQIIDAAETTGAQTAPGQVTLKCEELYPPPSWWPL